MMVKFCRDCKWSRPEAERPWALRCMNPEVNRRDAWALSTGGESYGTDTSTERSLNWLIGICGMRGALWEPKQPE